jgi:hypothetical protein
LVSYIKEKHRLKKICGPEREELTGNQRKLLGDLLFSPDVVQKIKSRKSILTKFYSPICTNMLLYVVLHCR